MLKFNVTQKIGKFVRVGDDYERVEVDHDFEVNNWDDLQSLLATLIDFGTGTMKFEITKKEVED